MRGTTAEDARPSSEPRESAAPNGIQVEDGGIGIRKHADAPFRARPVRALTVRQKRLFVLGLWSSDEK